MGDEIPLRCNNFSGPYGKRIEISIGKKILAFADENHPTLWSDQEDNEPVVKITDHELFMDEVWRELNREEEDGSTLVTRMLDKAIERAIEGGCDGINHNVRLLNILFLGLL